MGCGPTVCGSTPCVCLVCSVRAHCTAEGTEEQSDPGKEGALNPCPVEQEHRQAWAGSPLTACSELGSPQTPAPELAYSGVLGQAESALSRGAVLCPSPGPGAEGPCPLHTPGLGASLPTAPLGRALTPALTPGWAAFSPLSSVGSRLSVTKPPGAFVRG